MFAEIFAGIKVALGSAQHCDTQKVRRSMRPEHCNDLVTLPNVNAYLSTSLP
jgi:hypothetical protein